MVFAVFTAFVGYLVLGQLLLRAALRQRLASPHVGTSDPRRFLRAHLAVGIFVLIASAQTLVRPDDSGRTTALKMLLVVGGFLAAALLPEAQFRRSSKTSGITYGDIAVAFGRDAGFRLSQILLLLTPSAILWAFVKWQVGVPGTATSIVLSCLFAMVGLAVVFVTSPFLIRIFHRARPIDDPDLVQRLSVITEKAGIPLPSLYRMENRLQFATAMVTGILPRHRAIFISDPLLAQMTPDEITGVVAHEVAHVRERDLYAAFVRSVVGLVVFVGISTVLRTLLLRAGFPDGPVRVILTASIPSLLIGILYQLPASRKRESRADELAAAWVGGEHLAAALVRLCEINAMSGHASKMAKLLGSHPAIEERIAALGGRSSRPSV